MKAIAGENPSDELDPEQRNGVLQSLNDKIKSLENERANIVADQSRKGRAEKVKLARKLNEQINELFCLGENFKTKTDENNSNNTDDIVASTSGLAEDEINSDNLTEITVSQTHDPFILLKKVYTGRSS